MKIKAQEVAPRTVPSNYPEPFASRMSGKTKRKLGDYFGLTKFGVNLTSLNPGAESALLHQHSRQEEFIYILSGHPTLITDEGKFQLQPGDCCGFPAKGIAHHLINYTDSPVEFLEIGDRDKEDQIFYPNDDLCAISNDGKWEFTRKDGTAY